MFFFQSAISEKISSLSGMITTYSIHHLACPNKTLNQFLLMHPKYVKTQNWGKNENHKKKLLFLQFFVLPGLFEAKILAWDEVDCP